MSGVFGAGGEVGVRLVSALVWDFGWGRVVGRRHRDTGRLVGGLLVVCRAFGVAADLPRRFASWPGVCLSEKDGDFGWLLGGWLLGIELGDLEWGFLKRCCCAD